MVLEGGMHRGSPSPARAAGGDIQREKRKRAGGRAAKLFGEKTKRGQQNFWMEEEARARLCSVWGFGGNDYVCACVCVKGGGDAVISRA